MRRLLFILLIIMPLALVCIWLAVANRDLVTVSLDPLPIVLPPIPLFFVMLAGVLIGIVSVLPSASVKALWLRRKLKQSQKAMAALQSDHAALLAERDDLAARVRPEDARFVEAQTALLSPPGSLSGPSSQSVLPG